MKKEEGASRCPNNSYIYKTLVAFTIALFTGFKRLHENVLVCLSNNSFFGREDYVLVCGASHRNTVW